MAKKRTGQDRRAKGSPDQSKSRIRKSSVTRGQSARNRSAGAGTQSTRGETFHVLSDVRRNPELSVSEAARNRGVSLRSVRKHVGSQLKQDRPGGRIRVTKSDRLRVTLQIPSTKPDVLVPIHTKSSKERSLVGEWFASIKEAGRGDFSRLNQFPKGTYIDGVRLPTGAYEVQKILEAMETSESPFERLYAMAGSA